MQSPRFRWAFCQLEALKTLKSTRPKYVKKALEDLPRTQDATYERMLVGIDDMYREEALTALRWLAFEYRPLSLEELAEACIVNPSGNGNVETEDRGAPEDILEILSGLVVVESEDWAARIGFSDNKKLRAETLRRGERRIRLAHFSVKEYLVSRRIQDSEAAFYALQDSLVHEFIAQSCLVYLLHYSSHKDTGFEAEHWARFPLLRYACTCLLYTSPSPRD